MKELTPSELYVMKSIWDLGDHVRLAHILEHVNEVYHMNWKGQTVSTFLNKLVLKGFVESYRDGQYVHYDCLITEDAYRREQFQKEMSFWNQGNIRAYASSLFKAVKMSKEDIEELKAELDELEE